MSTETVPVYIRPPGALPEAEFVETCLRCAACLVACPYGALEEVGPEGGECAGTPYLNPDNVPCHECPGQDCAQVCGSGGLE